MKKYSSIYLLLCLAFPFWAQNTASNTDERPPLPEMEFTLTGGFYSGTQVTEILSPGAKIYYTTNGTMPQPINRHIYEGPILLDETMIVRAIAHNKNGVSLPISHTFFIDEPESVLPTVYIGVSPTLLFDPVKGLFMKGDNVIDTTWQKFGANFWSKKEISINTEIFEINQKCVFRCGTGMRLFGGMSRLFPQKSLTIVARNRYGDNRIRHKVFGEDGLKKFKFLVLRNSGSDFGKTHFRDAFMTNLTEGWDIEQQDSRPARVYINGKYWGIYNIREKVNRYFIDGHHKNIDKDSIDLLEHRIAVKRGNKQTYNALLRYLRANNLHLPSNYTYVKSQIDIDNFIDYQVAQIYFDNQDAGGNIKYWRPNNKNGKWRWILYDTDWGFGLHDEKAYTNNSLDFHTEPNGPEWPNPAWSTFILRKLLENQEFERAFINRFADRLNTAFDTTLVSNNLRRYRDQIEPEIPRHLKRWRLSNSRRIEHIERMETFARERPAYVWRHLEEKFKPGERRKLRLYASEGGKIKLNDNLKIKAGKPFEGIYFSKVPVKIFANPKLGYRFSHWEGVDVADNDRELTILLTNNITSIKAVFEPFNHPAAGKVMINEISCNNKKSGDWVEIYNYSDTPVNLENWTFTDSNNKFRFPNITLPAKDYVVLCEHTQSFGRAFPAAYRFIGDLGFGLNKRGEDLALYDSEGAWIDSLSYLIPPQDTMFTLNLLLPNLNNGDFSNWELRNGEGTPNSANPYYVESSIQIKRDNWLQSSIAFAVILMCILLLIFRNQGKI